MKVSKNSSVDIWGPIFTNILNEWGDNILSPSLEKIRSGNLILPRKGEIGEFLATSNQKKLTSKNVIEKKRIPLERNTKGSFFDIVADEYEMAVHSYKTPIISRVLEILSPLIGPNIRILDAACGTGLEVISLAKIVYQSEVVGVDLSRNMIFRAVRNIKETDLQNATVMQFDITQKLEGTLFDFDIIFCHLSFGYFFNKELTTDNFHKILNSTGNVVVIEPDANFANRLSLKLHKKIIPTFQGIQSKEEMINLFIQQGFEIKYWEEILPGIILYIFTKNF